MPVATKAFFLEFGISNVVLVLLIGGLRRPGYYASFLDDIRFWLDTCLKEDVRPDLFYLDSNFVFFDFPTIGLEIPPWAGDEVFLEFLLLF